MAKTLLGLTSVLNNINARVLKINSSEDGIES
jgi:hypothetical protein